MLRRRQMSVQSKASLGEPCDETAKMIPKRRKIRAAVDLHTEDTAVSKRHNNVYIKRLENGDRPAIRRGV